VLTHRRCWWKRWAPYGGRAGVRTKDETCRIEAASLPWSIFVFSGDTAETPGQKQLDEFLKARLKHMEAVLAGREWLAGTFSIADVLMADVLRLVDRFDGLAKHPACRNYVVRATARPSFVKAHADQMAHFAAAD
jgi:glutathione S-transferase